MRITCPNCSAQYEIDADLIPSEGRDVQCSNCGTSWFQEGRPLAATAAQTRAGRRNASPSAPAEPDPDKIAAQADAPMRSDAPVEAGGASGAEEEAAPKSPPKPQRRAMADEATLNVLKEERAHADRLRDGRPADGQLLNSPAGQDADNAPRSLPASTATNEQAGRPSPSPEPFRGAHSTTDAVTRPDPPTPFEPPLPRRSDPHEAAVDERARVAAAAALDRARRSDPLQAPSPSRTRLPEPDPGLVSSGRLARRDLLPDIEDINASLRPDVVVLEGGASRPAHTPRGGFGMGFFITLAVLAIPVAAYVFADPLTKAFPEAASEMGAYVSWIDERRIALDAGVRALTARIAAND